QQVERVPHAPHACQHYHKYHGGDQEQVAVDGVEAREAHVLQNRELGGVHDPLQQVGEAADHQPEDDAHQHQQVQAPLPHHEQEVVEHARERHHDQHFEEELGVRAYLQQAVGAQEEDEHRLDEHV